MPTARCHSMSTDPAAESAALDAYSAIVTSVAAQLTPKVAALRIQSRRGESAGSAVVLTGESHLVTNAHVVGDAGGALRSSPTARSPTSTSWAVTRCPTSPSSAPTVRCRPRPSTATPTRSSSARSWWPSATRWASQAR